MVEDESSAESFQEDIDSVSNWHKKCLMKSNSSKYKVTYFGNKNNGYDIFYLKT